MCDLLLPQASTGNKFVSNFLPKKNVLDLTLHITVELLLFTSRKGNSYIHHNSDRVVVAARTTAGMVSS